VFAHYSRGSGGSEAIGRVAYGDDAGGVAELLGKVQLLSCTTRNNKSSEIRNQ
jgi:hypothetical protein